MDVNGYDDNSDIINNNTNNNTKPSAVNVIGDHGNSDPYNTMDVNGYDDNSDIINNNTKQYAVSVIGDDSTGLRVDGSKKKFKKKNIVPHNLLSNKVKRLADNVIGDPAQQSSKIQKLEIEPTYNVVGYGGKQTKRKKKNQSKPKQSKTKRKKTKQNKTKRKKTKRTKTKRNKKN